MRIETDMPLATAIGEALDQGPRVSELRAMRQALQQRATILQNELPHAAPEERDRLEHEISVLRQQINVLREEEAITDFVEESVRFAWNARQAQETE